MVLLDVFIFFFYFWSELLASPENFFEVRCRYMIDSLEAAQDMFSCEF